MDRRALRGLIVAAAVVAGCGGSGDRDEAASRPDSAGEWRRVEPGGRTGCARGGRFAFWARIARRDRLLVYFQPGGGCFDARTCAPGSDWFDDSVDAGDDPSSGRGIFDLDHSANPFRDWSIVFVPSCTGDVHLGDRIARYGGVVVRHRGWTNARAALRWTFAHFRAPRSVVVAGCSAGSVGSAFHAPAILERYRGARVAQLGDSLAFVFHRPVRLTDWGAHRHFPRFFRIGPRRFTMVEYLTALARRYPGRTFARFNYAGDDVQEAFYEAVGGRRREFEARLRQAERDLKRAAPNYRSFLACGDAHCVLPRDGFYSLTVQGTRLREWTAALAAGRHVGCPLCRR